MLIPDGTGTDQVCSRVTMNKLPDEVLLDIFGFCMTCSLPPPAYKDDAWHTLVHVCRRWRYVVFGSPRRLNLRLLCINRRRVKTLDIWPELPIIILVDNRALLSIANVVPVLKRNDRVCKIVLDNVPGPLFARLAKKMAEPFPALIELELTSFNVDSPMLPDSFLGGSVPSLRSLLLWGISFPGLGRLLSSTRDLVTLSLNFFPPSEYISPEAMVAILSKLARLASLHLNFETPRFWTRGASREPPALTRVVLPALTTFSFCGYGAYLDDIVSRIDAPLECIAVTFSDQLVVSDIPMLRDFISRTKIPNAPHQADIYFSTIYATISLFQRKGDVDFKVLYLEFPFSTDTLAGLSSLAQACNSLLPPLPSLDQLCIHNSDLEIQLQYATKNKNAQWIELLRPFITVKDLALGEPVVLSVTSALQGLVGRGVTEVLPVLQNISIEGLQSSCPVPKGIAKFISARELSGRPVVVQHRETKQLRC